jgi:serine/threonine-protein kinase
LQEDTVMGSRRRLVLRALGSGVAAAALSGCLDPNNDATGTGTPTPAAPSALTGEWPAFARDARNTGVAATSGPTAEPVVAWSFETGGRIYDGVAVAHGTVFVPSTDGTLYALDAADGTERWRFPVLGAVRTTPAVAGDTVYVGGDRGGLYALDVETGRSRWTSLLTAEFSLSHPTVVDGTVYVGSNEGVCYAVDAATGIVMWELDTGADVAASPAVADDTVYVGWRAGLDGGPASSGEGGLDAVSTGGDRQWRIEPGQVDGSPTVVDGVVYVGSRNAAHAFEAATGEELWRFEPGYNTGSPTVVDGLAFLGSGSSTFYAVDADTGEEVWTYTPGKWPQYAPVVADGVVYLCSWATRVYALDARTGERYWRRSLANPLSDPAVVDGTVYVAPDDTVVALREA